MLSNNRGDVNLDVKSKSVPAIINTEMPGQNGFANHKFPESIYAGATLSQRTGEVILKVVNFSPVPQLTTINIKGIGRIKGKCTAEILSNKNITAVNSFEKPLNVASKTEKFNCSGPEFKYELKANSFTIIRIPAE
jgi:alpha-N-arabinofuranosidase